MQPALASLDESGCSLLTAYACFYCISESRLPLEARLTELLPADSSPPRRRKPLRGTWTSWTYRKNCSLWCGSILFSTFVLKEPLQMNHVARIFVVCVGVHAAMNRGGLLTFPAALHAAGAGENNKVIHSENWRKQTDFEGSLFALADIIIYIYTCKSTIWKLWFLSFSLPNVRRVYVNG